MGFLDDLLPIRRIYLDNVEQEFVRDLYLDSDDFDLTVDATNRTGTLVPRSASIAGDSTGTVAVSATDFDYTVTVNSRLRTRLRELATTDATTTSIFEATLPEGNTSVDVYIVADQSGSANGAVYKLKRRFLNAAGVVTAKSLVSVEVEEDDAAWDATIDNSGTTVRVRVTGKAATNIRWIAAIQMLEVER